MPGQCLVWCLGIAAGLMQLLGLRRLPGASEGQNMSKQLAGHADKAVRPMLL